MRLEANILMASEQFIPSRISTGRSFVPLRGLDQISEADPNSEMDTQRRDPVIRARRQQANLDNSSTIELSRLASARQTQQQTMIIHSSSLSEPKPINEFRVEFDLLWRHNLNETHIDHIVLTFFPDYYSIYCDPMMQ